MRDPLTQRLEDHLNRPSNKLLLVIHVAERLKLSPRTVRLKAEMGILPGFKLSADSRIWYFKESDIDALVEKQRARFVDDVESA
jgi:hypothetical protein